MALVTVLFPVHRESPYLMEALASVLNQDFDDFEVLFLDNSELGLPKHLWNFDKRVKYVKLPANYGLSETLNYGIRNATSKYLIRMDFDDISMPSRISRQVNFMENNTEIDISGTGIRVIENFSSKATSGDVDLFRPIDWREITTYLLNKNPLFHPTVIMRRETLLKFDLFYNPKYDAAEDLELWMRASHKIKISNLGEVLLSYRLHENQFSREDGINSRFQSAKIRARHSLWFVMHHPDDWKLGIKTLGKNLSYLLGNLIRYLKRPRFNKFS